MSHFANNLKTAVLLASLASLSVFVGYLFGGQFGMIIGLGVGAVLTLGSFFFSDKIALASMHAQPCPPGHPLHSMVERLSQRAGIPMPRVYIAPTSAPNAFATGRSPSNSAVCATQGLLEILTEEEVAGVMAHELAHVKHRDTLITALAATFAAAISILVQFGFMLSHNSRSRDRNGGGGVQLVLMLVAMILAPLAAGLIQMAISRQREYAADREGGIICGDPMYLATALEKVAGGAARIPMESSPAFNAMMIVEPMNLAGNLAGLFQTHPPLEKRLMNLIGRPSTRR